MTKKKILKLLLILTLTFANSNVLAQDDDILRNTTNDLMVVAGIGAAGAVLGLSTLSFVDKPGDHVKNIVVGAAVGIIIGVGVVAYSQANKSQDFYDRNSGEAKGESASFSTDERQKWALAHHGKLNNSFESNSPKTQWLNYSFRF